jgi:membrane protease YdiL (CAAX protease family)
MTPTPDVPVGFVRAMLALGTVLFFGAQLVLWLVIGLELPDTVLLALLLVALPVLALAQLPLAKNAPVDRLSVYWGSIGALWLLGGASWLVGTRADGAQGVGLVLLPLGDLVTWSVGLTAGGLLIILSFRATAVAAKVKDAPLLRRLLPRTPKERGVFTLLSLAAGGGEELAYRGYAIPVLVPLLGTTGAVVLSSVVFGILHGYQGLLGMLRTGVMGALLAWGFLVTGSLWPPIIAHVAIDIIAGIVLGERLLSIDGSEKLLEPNLQSSEF